MALTEAPVETGSKSDGHHIAEVVDFLRHYQGKGSPTPEILDGRYRVDTATPLPDFDRKTAKAYAVADQTDTTRQLLALVCKPGTVQRHRVIPLLKAVPHPNLMKLVAAGPVHIPSLSEERFVLVYERPKGEKLSALLARTTTPINESFIRSQIITPIAAAIGHLGERDLSHGCINPDNIFYGDTLVVGDCISEPCGYSQTFIYEPPERIQAMPAGKGEGTVSHDYYALGIMTLGILFGSNYLASLPREALILRMMSEGPYDALTRNRSISEIFSDFLHGTLALYTFDRWGAAEVKAWLDGKRSNSLYLPPPNEALRPLDFFDGQHYDTKRQVAHALYMNWDKMLPVLEGGQLLHWVQISLRTPELTDSFQKICKSAIDLAGRNEAQYAEQLMRLIASFDPVGPMRIGALSMHPDGLDTIIAELMANKSEKELQLYAKFIEYGMINFIIDQQRKLRNYVQSSSVTTILQRLDKLRISIRYSGLGFGVERILYEMNPDLSCQSRLLAGQYVNTLEGILLRLDKLASSQSKDNDPIDRHISAYVASKLNIQHELKLPELSGIPTMASNRAIIALRLLAQAQQRANPGPLHGLTHWMAVRIFPALDSIHSRTTRNSMKSQIIEAAQSGSLIALATLVINPDYATADANGFHRAKQIFAEHTLAIYNYRTGTHIEQQSNELGYAISRLCACAALGLTMISMAMGS